MFKKLMNVLLVSLFLGINFGPSLVLAQASSPAPVIASPTPNVTVTQIDNAVPAQDANSLIGQIFSLLATGKVTAAVGALVVLLTYLFRKYYVDTGKVGSGTLPWLSMVLAGLFAVGSNLLLGATPLAAAEAFLFAGPTASTLWSAIFKLVAKKVV